MSQQEIVDPKAPLKEEIAGMCKKIFHRALYKAPGRMQMISFFPGVNLRHHVKTSVS